MHRRGRCHRATYGFTLLEMMAAVAILAVASSTVYFTNSSALATQMRLEEQTIAQWILTYHANQAKLQSQISRSRYRSAMPISAQSGYLKVAGIDWEVKSVPLVSNQFGIQRLRLEIYRIVDGKPIGPIRDYETVVAGEAPW